MTNLRHTLLTTMLMTLGLLAIPGSVRADDPPANDAAAKPGDAPHVGTDNETKPANESLVYEVIEVQSFRDKKFPKVAGAGTDPRKDAGWSNIKKGDVLGSGQQVFVPSRCKLKLVARPADPPTVLLIESGTVIYIDTLEFTPEGTAQSRIKLGYGAIRAGVAESGVRSDMEIESPEATLSKRGTDIFRFESGNGKFRISLSEGGRGLLHAAMNQSGYSGQLQSIRGLRFRSVRAGQMVTHQMMQAIDRVQFDREVNINDILALQGNDQLFQLLNSRGIGILFPDGTRGFGFTDPSGQLGPGGLNGDNPLGTNPKILQPKRPGIDQPDGNFGVGQGSLGNIFGDNNRTTAGRRVSDCKQRDAHGACSTASPAGKR